MKQPMFNILKVLASAVYFSALAFGCHKQEEKETVIGKWETVSAVGFEFEYSISKDSHCRKLPEYFGQTEFCYTYSTNGSTMYVNSNDPETWEWSFVSPEIADVTVTGTNGERTRMILKKTD